MKQVDILIINDSEAKQLTQESNLIKAGRQILTYGPSRVIIKKGEHGALSLTESEFFALPAYPLASVSDPTGAGDSFAGAFAGHLAHSKNYSFSSISNALIYANAVASFCVEKFGVENMLKISKEEIKKRINFIEKHNN